jgi:hypothetical protein
MELLNHPLIALLVLLLCLPSCAISRFRKKQSPTLLNSSLPSLSSLSSNFDQYHFHPAALRRESKEVTPPISMSNMKNEKTSASLAILQVRAESVGRRLQIILPQIYSDINSARIHLLSAVQNCNGGGNWASIIVSDSASARTSTNEAVRATQQAEKLLDQFANIDITRLDIVVEEIIQLIAKAKLSLEIAAHDVQKSASTPFNNNFGGLILQAQKLVHSEMKLATKYLLHAVSICWVKTSGQSKSTVIRGGDGNSDSLHLTLYSTKLVDENIAEQKVLPFKPPVMNKMNLSVVVTSKKPLKKITSTCYTFCKNRKNQKNVIKQSGCIHGCRVARAVLNDYSWPGKWTNRVDCSEYCEKTVDQVMLEIAKSERLAPSISKMEKEDRRAEWVAECHYSCKRS